MKQEMNSSVEQHIASTKNLLKAAEMFVSGAEDPHTLTSTAENFINMALSNQGLFIVNIIGLVPMLKHQFYILLSS